MSQNAARTALSAMATYGNELRVLRQRAGYSLVEVARELTNLGIATSNIAVSRWENNYNNPTLEQFLALCNLYGVRDVRQVLQNHDYDNMETDLNHEGLNELKHFKDLLVHNPRYQRTSTMTAMERDMYAPSESRKQNSSAEKENAVLSKSYSDDTSFGADLDEELVRVLPQPEIGGLTIEPFVPDKSAKGQTAERKRRASRRTRLPREIKCYTVGPAAGVGNVINDADFEMVAVPEYVPKTADFAVQVCGDSMEPVLKDGDYLFVHTQETLDSGDVGVVTLNDSTYVKQIRTVNNMSWLVSANPAYDPIPIRDSDHLLIHGKVVSPKIRKTEIRLPESLKDN